MIVSAARPPQAMTVIVRVFNGVCNVVFEGVRVFNVMFECVSVCDSEGV